MAKVFGMHMITLRPGVKEEDFEKFVTEEMYPLPTFEGVKNYLLKGDRGDREGKYLVMSEFESVEARDRMVPSPDQPSEEAQKFQEAHAAEFEKVLEKWATFSASIFGENTIYTDYVVVGK